MKYHNQDKTAECNFFNSQQKQVAVNIVTTIVLNVNNCVTSSALKVKVNRCLIEWEKHHDMMIHSDVNLHLAFYNLEKKKNTS